MKPAVKKHDTQCLVAYALNAVGDRWSLLIIRDMMLYGKRRYRDFLNSKEGIATNILADRLRHLEAVGILEKERDPQNRRSFIYSLTEKGLQLAPVLIEIIRWSGRYAPLNALRKDLITRADIDREELVREFQARASA